MSGRFGWLALTCGLFSMGVFGAALAAENVPTAASLEFFEKHIRPLLADRCYKCHGGEKQESALRLDTLAGMTVGGDSGPAIVPGKPEQSLLIAAVGYQDDNLRMPPDKKLSDVEIARLAEWIKLGAPHPDGTGVPAPAARPKIDLAAARNHWSFQPVVKPQLPHVAKADWPQSDLDLFMLAKLEEHGLSPAPAADKLTLIRRATFDLTGLPPTPREVADFLADSSPDAFARVVDRLLQSPRYGERWGRFWLDVARYADSNGLDENICHGNAWRYRDYVIGVFNADKPFDQFVVEQIAGDLLPGNDSLSEAERHERLIAVGFLTLGPKVLAEVDKTKMEMDIIDEQVSTVGSAFLALTIGCSRCHDHKFDPISAEDYYGLAGIFKSTKTMESFKTIARWWENPIATADDLKRKAEHESRVAEAKSALAEFVKAANEKVLAGLPADAKKPDAEKDFEALYSEETKAELKKQRDAIAALEADAPAMPSAMGVTDREIVDLAVHIRGSHLTLGQVVPRRFPLVLAGEQQPPMPADASGRLALAQWLVGPNQPLTSRVIVNRVWRWHFGTGIVPSTDNFGLLGERPINQPLLDWLAAEFVESGWSIKDLHRRIMLSSVYQTSSHHDPAAIAIDPENRFHWRANVRRLEVESLRDSLLFVSGRLDERMGGSTLHVKNREFFFDHTSKDKTSYASRQRSVYLPIVRNNLYDVFSLFDYTDASVSQGDRNSTTVAPQALFLMNGDLVIDSADELADQHLAIPNERRNEAGQAEFDDTPRIRELYSRCFAREPSSAEISRAIAFLTQFETEFTPEFPPPPSGESSAETTAEYSAKSAAAVAATRRQAWSALCQACMASSEFCFVK